MKVEVYELCLLKFDYEDIVLTSAQLDEIGFSIGDLAGSRDSLAKRDGWYIYPVIIGDQLDKLRGKADILEAEIGYYHHRIIMRLKIDLPGGNFDGVRLVRDGLSELFKTLVEEIRAQNPDLIKFCYTYPLIIVVEPWWERLVNRIRNRKASNGSVVFSRETTSLAFELRERSALNPVGTRINIRISIPGTVMFASGKISDRMLLDMINGTYQHCLYEKKLIDAASDSEPQNSMNETVLVRLWEHILNTMGGRSVDINLSRMTYTTMFVALLALILSLLGSLDAIGDLGVSMAAWVKEIFH